jgi:hypothetical protein
MIVADDHRYPVTRNETRPDLPRVDQIEIRMAVDPIGFSWLLDRADAS